jgi:hypothetical protein
LWSCSVIRHLNTGVGKFFKNPFSIMQQILRPHSTCLLEADFVLGIKWVSIKNSKSITPDFSSSCQNLIYPCLIAKKKKKLYNNDLTKETADRFNTFRSIAKFCVRFDDMNLHLRCIVSMATFRKQAKLL